MFKLLLIIGITAYFAYSIGKRLGENKAIEKEDRPADESNIIDAEIIEDDKEE